MEPFFVNGPDLISTTSVEGPERADFSAPMLNRGLVLEPLLVRTGPGSARPSGRGRGLLLDLVRCYWSLCGREGAPFESFCGGIPVGQGRLLPHVPRARQLLGRGTCWCITPEGRRSRVDVESSLRWRAFLIRPLRAPRVPAQCTRDPVCAASAGRYGHRSPPSCLAPPDTHPEAVAHPACCALTQNKHALGGFAFRPISLVCGRGGPRPVPPILPWRHAGPTKGDAVHPAHRVTKGCL